MRKLLDVEMFPMLDFQVDFLEFLTIKHFSTQIEKWERMKEIWANKLD